MGIFIGQVRLNDNAIRLVNDRLRSYYGRLLIEKAYEWIILFIQERLSSIKESDYNNFLYTVFLDELKKMRRFDIDI